jgi:hypothetical protein
MKEITGNQIYVGKDLILINDDLGLCSFVGAILEGLRAQKNVNQTEIDQIRDRLVRTWNGLHVPWKKLQGIENLSKGFAPADIVDITRVVTGRRIVLEVKSGQSSRDLRQDIRETILNDQPVIAWENSHAIVAVKYRSAGHLREMLQVKDTLEARYKHRPMDIKDFSELVLKENSDKHFLIVKNLRNLIF